jgi:hypothetical protein
LRGKIRIGGCEMTHADEPHPRAPLLRVKLGELTLRVHHTGVQQLLADMPLSFLAERREGG